MLEEGNVILFTNDTYLKAKVKNGYIATKLACNTNVQKHLCLAMFDLTLQNAKNCPLKLCSEYE